MALEARISSDMFRNLLEDFGPLASSNVFPPPGRVKGSICGTSSGKEGPVEDRGGRDRLDHLLSPEILVCLWSAKSSTAPLGKVGRPWTRCCSRRPQEELCSPTREKVGSTAKSGRTQFRSREINTEKRAFQDGLEETSHSENEDISQYFRSIHMCFYYILLNSSRISMSILGQ